MWAKMANEVNYSPTEIKNTNQMLQEYLAKLTKVYIGEGVKYPHLTEENEGCFEFSESIQEKNVIFEQFGELLVYTRCETIKCIDENLNFLITQYEESITARNAQYKDLTEISISWVVRLICELVNAYIRNQTVIKSYDRKELQICAKIIKLILFTNKIDRVSPHLESALIAFMIAFKKYLCSMSDSQGDDLNLIAKEDIDVISFITGISSFSDILDVFINRIFRDLAVWGNHKQMLKEISNVLENFTLGSSIITLLKASKSITELNNCHWARIFTSFYPKMESKIAEVLCKVAFYEDSEQLSKLLISIAPQFENIKTLTLKSTIDATSKQFTLKILYMLTGILKTLYVMSQFDIFFSWIYGDRLAIIRNISKCSWCGPDIIKAIIMFYMELSCNTTHRLRFDTVSINGILIFKEVAEQIASFSSLVRSVNVIKNAYEEKYRFFKILFALFRQCIRGGFVNFGVFMLYNDPVFAQVLNQVMAAVTKIGFEELSAYQKLQQEASLLIDDVCSTHSSFLILNLNDDTLMDMFNLVMNLINSENNDIVSHSCSSITSFYDFMLNTMKNPAHPIYGITLQNRIKEFVSTRAELSYALLKKVLSVICHEEGPQLYLFSSPLYCLILANGSSQFVKAKTEVLEIEKNTDVREKIGNELDKLIQGMVPEYSDQAKQQFYKRYTCFSNAIKMMI